MRESRTKAISDIAESLVALYDQPFGGKPRGRYRISMKLMCRLYGRHRIWPEQIEALRRELYELGYTLVDQQNYFAVIGHQTFVNYRRVNEAGFEAAIGASISGGAASSVG